MNYAKHHIPLPPPERGPLKVHECPGCGCRSATWESEHARPRNWSDDGYCHTCSGRFQKQSQRARRKR